MTRKTILVIDDEKDIRHMLCKLLHRSGYSTVTACNGLDAINEIQKRAIDLVITDILMPDKEGIETIIELRKKYSDIKIIAMSGGGRGEAAHYLDMAKIYGADLIFSKPFEHSDILTAVEQLLEPATQTLTSSQ